MNTKHISEKIKEIVSNPKFKEFMFLILIFIISFIFRRIGLKYGFPLLTHPDEPISLNPVYHMTVNRTFNPSDFKRPDQIHYFIYFFYLNILSFIKFGKSFAQTFLENQLTFYFYARLLIAVIGSIIPIAAYKIGKEFKLDFSIPAALFFAFFPYYIVHSHFITPDITITLFSLLIILFSIRFLKRKEDKQIYLATIFAAINTAEKYPGLLSFGIIIVALFLYAIEIKSPRINFDFNLFIKKFFATLGIYILALFISAPNIFIEYGNVIDSIIIEARSTHLGADNLGWGGNILFYIEQFAAESNPVILFLIFMGLFTSIRIKDKTGILLLYGLAYCVIMSKLDLHWVRWALPMYTTPLLLASLGVGYLWNAINNKKTQKYLFMLIISLAVFQQMITSLSYSARMGFTDTRVIALEFCNQNGITTDNAIYEGYTPLFPQFYKTIFDQDLDSWNENIKYVVLSSNMYGRYFNEPDRYAKEVNYYQDIEHNHILLEEFTPTPNPVNLQGKIDDIIYYFLRYFNKTQNKRFTGPTIRIFKIVD